jgi:hypothetical protein
MDKLIIKGAREHNLKNIDLELPGDKLIVVSGLSDSFVGYGRLSGAKQRFPCTACGTGADIRRSN